MATTVSKSKFKPLALEFFRKVQETQEELIITDHGKPVLRIVPYIEDPATALQTLRGSVLQYLDPTKPVALEDWTALQ